MTDRSKRKVSQAFSAAQIAAVVGLSIYFAYCEGLYDASSEKVGSDLPADSDDSVPSPKSTSLDGE